MISDTKKANMKIIKRIRICIIVMLGLSIATIAYLNTGISAGESGKRIVSIVMSLILVFNAVLIFNLMSKYLSKSIFLLKDIFSKGSSGDLEMRFPVKAGAKDEFNELGVLLNNFMDKVHDAIKEVTDVAHNLGASSEEVSITISHFAENSQSQAASSEEMTAAMEEISAGVDNVSENARFQYDKFKDFISIMEELSEMINSMADMLANAQELSKRVSVQAKSGNESLNMMDTMMSQVTESSRKVSEIIDIIDTVSDKINLLSLNAAIEAARAGESGRGFAVVADEISKLAEQTAASISDIDLLIKKNNEEIVAGMRNVGDTVSNIGGIIEGVESINEMMDSIYANMGMQQTTNDLVNSTTEELRVRSEEVKNALEEQKIAISEVMKSITNNNDLIQSSAAGAEEMNANAGNLSSMAESLLAKVGLFNV
ncbi:MAG: hypothetical protein JW864_09975 [Spirochaetes bacterium]|nr:hypothetical protein [Spirochaetota bacterium]